MKGFERSVELKNVTASKAAVDPKPSFRLTLPPQHRLALADEASELHHEEPETASRFCFNDD